MAHVLTPDAVSMPPATRVDLRRLARADDAPALIDDRGSLSFADLAEHAARVAALLAARGLRTQQRVALVTSDSRAVTALAPAIVASGFTLVVVDPGGTPDTVMRALRASHADALIVDAPLLAGLRQSVGDALPAALWSVGDAAGSAGGALGLLARAMGRARPAVPEVFAALAEVTVADSVLVDVPDDAAAYVMFTSGSTSMPKGVEISRRALGAHLATLARQLGYGPGTRLLNVLPFHHTDGLIHGPMMAAFTGTTLVRPFAFATPRLAELPAVIRDAKVTHFLTVPTVLSLIQRLLGDQDDLFRTKDFRVLVSTAGYLRPDLWQDFEAAFGQPVANLYGLTETVSGALYCGPGEDTRRLDTLGRPVDMHVRVVGESGRDVDAGSPGELWLAGDNVMSGYIGDAAATAEVLRDGWFRTGDIVRVDEDGFFHFVGRSKNVIKRGGTTIYPEDVLRGLEGVPGVRGAAVVGADDPVFEQIVVGCVELEPGALLRDVETRARAALPREVMPDKLFAMEVLPRGPSGKILQERVREYVLTSLAPKSSAEATPADLVIGVMADVLNVGVETLERGDDPSTLPAWDSYAHMELVVALEKAFEIKLGARDIMRMRSVGDVIDMIAQKL